MDFWILLLMGAIAGVIVGYLKGRDEREKNELYAKSIREQKEKNEALALIIESLFSYKISELKTSDPSEYFRCLLNSDLELRIIPEILYEDYSYIINDEVTLFDRTLVIEANLPHEDDIGVKGYFHNFNPMKFSKAELPGLYEKILYSICLNSIQSSINIDKENFFDAILFNGHVNGYSPTTGQWEDKLIMSLYVTKQQFSEIDVTHVDPKACFKSLKGISAAKLINLVPVQPVMSFNRNDRRFVDSHNVSTNSGTNLASMDWQEFEHLVRQVLELEFGENGGEVKVTQASRDGGVDAVIFDPDPLRGGKIVVQAKRYTNTVPIESVRALATVVRQENAIKGIMITTSDYGPDSYDLCKETPILLLNGGHLLSLLQKNGIDGYIDIGEAKKAQKEV